MPDGVTQSKIAQIVDYTAVVAARIPGVVSVAASGQGYYEDPKNPGEKIRAFGNNAIDGFSHASELPNVPAVEWVTQSGTVRLTWNIPMRLYVDSGDLATVRQTVLPFYDAYLAAFIGDRLLGGLVLYSQIKSFSIGNANNWSWLEIRLEAQEMVTYPQAEA